MRDRIRDVADALKDKASIPMVKAKLALIAAVSEEGYWADITLEQVEHVRSELRALAQFVEVRPRAARYTDFEDEVDLLALGDYVPVPIQSTGVSARQYRKKVDRLLRENDDHIVIAKVRRNQPLTPVDLEELERLLFDDEAPEDPA